MTSIKDLKISNSPYTNEIYAYLGKAHKIRDNAVLIKSEKKDITNTCILVVATKLKQELKDANKENKVVISASIEYKIEGIGYLQFSKKRPYHKEGEPYTQIIMKIKKE